MHSNVVRRNSHGYNYTTTSAQISTTSWHHCNRCRLIEESTERKLKCTRAKRKENICTTMAGSNCSWLNRADACHSNDHSLNDPTFFVHGLEIKKLPSIRFIVLEITRQTFNWLVANRKVHYFNEAEAHERKLNVIITILLSRFPANFWRSVYSAQCSGSGLMLLSHSEPVTIVQNIWQRTLLAVL